MKQSTSQENITFDNELTNLSLQELEFYKVLDIIAKYANSDLGKRIIANSKFFNDSKLLSEELDLIQEVRNLLMKGDSFPFGNLKDVYSIIYKSQIEKAALSPIELYQILELLRISKEMKSFLRSRSEDVQNLFLRSDLLIENKLLEKHIDEAIDITGMVKDNASRELTRIRREIIDKSAQLRNRLNKLLKKYTDEEFAREDFVSIRDGRFVIPIKVENKRTISGIIHGASQTGSTVFVEPSEIVELNNELSLLENEEKREIYKILLNLTAEIRQYAKDLIKSLDILGYFDSIYAKAVFSIEFDGMKPKIVNENYLYLKNSKHPLLVASKGLKNVVPLSVELTSEKRGILISGPNAGGKTIALKTIGINLALAMTGNFPIGECITNIRAIYTYIGDNQSIQNDLSTFSAQILRLQKIISASFSETLVLVDEIGSGTDPVEGSAIASGILETFAEMNLFFLATTHQSSLKTFALNRDEIQNASLEFDERNLKPTYKFQVGIPGNSYAFSLSKSIGLSDLVLKRARKYLDNKQQELEKGIKLLQFYQKKSLQALNEAQKERAKAKKISDEFEQKYSDFKKRKSELLIEARKEASKIFENSNALIEKTIKEIREEKKQFAEIKKEFAQQKQNLIETIDVDEKESNSNISSNKAEQIKNIPTTSENIDLKIGQFVQYSENQSIGKIVELDKQKKIAIIEINGIKFKIKNKLLTIVNNYTTKEEIKSNKAFTDNIKFDVQTRLDIRGERVEVALRKVDEFISNAILSNATLLTIIHGKGTGALREAIQSMLNHHQSIKSYRDGDLIEGGSGVTIIEL
jgi:DNA mismatch repair protein MutS2